MVAFMADERGSGISRACRLAGYPKSMYYYKRRTDDDTEVEAAIREAARHGDGFWKIYARLRKAGRPWNHKRVYRVYRELRLNKRTRLRRRVPAREPCHLSAPPAPCDTWSLDFVSDKLEGGRTFRVLNVLDDCTREAVAMEVSMSMPASRVVKTLEKTIFIHGKPRRIRTDNGLEFISGLLADWCKANGIEHVFTQPGCPTQNSYVERFNGSYRRGVLDAYLFRTLGEARDITAAWQADYNEARPHESLGDMTPTEYKESLTR